MNREQLKEFIYDKLTNNLSVSSICSTIINNSQLKYDVYYYTSYLPNKCKIAERVYHIYYDIPSINSNVQCRVCGNKSRFMSFKKGYSRFCGTKCSNNDWEVKRLKESKKENKREEIKKKSEESYIIKHGVSHHMKTQSSKNTIVKKQKELHNSYIDFSIELLDKEKLREFILSQLESKSYRQVCSKIVNNKLYKSSLFYWTNYLESDCIISERIYHIIHNLTHISNEIKCPICNNKSKFKNINKGYQKFCSNVCSNKDIHKIELSNRNRRNTNIEKYGVENIMQTSLYFGTKKFSYKRHDYQLPSGKWTKLQGYEPQALEYLLTIYNEDDILTETYNMPEIWYTIEESAHRYYPDFYIPKDNLIIEVKSEFTYNNQLERNLIKSQATKDSGYNFQFMIID